MTKKLILFIIGSAIIGSGAFFLFPHITGGILQLKVIGGLALATTLVQAVAVYYFFTSLLAHQESTGRAVFQGRTLAGDCFRRPGDRKLYGSDYQSNRFLNDQLVLQLRLKYIAGVPYRHIFYGSGNRPQADQP